MFFVISGYDSPPTGRERKEGSTATFVPLVRLATFSRTFIDVEMRTLDMKRKSNEPEVPLLTQSDSRTV
jgi:hypothetical protein